MKVAMLYPKFSAAHSVHLVRGLLAALGAPLVVRLLGELAELDLGPLVARAIDACVARRVPAEGLLLLQVLQVLLYTDNLSGTLGVLFLVVCGLDFLVLLHLGPLRRAEAIRHVPSPHSNGRRRSSAGFHKLA